MRQLTTKVIYSVGKTQKSTVWKFLPIYLRATHYHTHRIAYAAYTT